jgi:hypothetical protein
MMRKIGMNSELDDEWIFCNFGHSGISQQGTGTQYVEMSASNMLTPKLAHWLTNRTGYPGL